MNRELADPILRDSPKKIILVSGPRQTGKTTLAKSLKPEYDYFNYDVPEDRLSLEERSWNRNKPLVVMDELHKKSGWKLFLKGIYDGEGIPPSLVVTGSARMDAFRKVGDSLAGRFFAFRLHPFDIRELAEQMEPHETMERILQFGGFPEPFLENDFTFYRRWKRTHLDIILRQDMLDLTAVTNIQAMETLLELLRHRVGSPVSYASLARDLQKDPQTVKSWLILLENLYVIFPVRPRHKNIARSILKEPKYYFFDTGRVEGDGPRLENLVACSLYKYAHFLEDTEGLKTELNYLRTKDGRELDFIFSVEDEVRAGFEVKRSDTNLSPAFRYFENILDGAKKVQLVAYPDREKTYPDGVEVRDLAEYLSRLSLV